MALALPWNGIRDESFRRETWPNFGSPPRTMWNVWRQALKTAFLGRGRRLKQPLGRWFHLDPAQSWLLDRDGSLYQLCNGKWLYHCPILRRQHLPDFAVTGRPCQAPLSLYHELSFIKQEERLSAQGIV
jgi:hypothetical protein